MVHRYHLDLTSTLGEEKHLQLLRSILLFAISIYSIYLLYDALKHGKKGDIIMAVIIIVLLIMTRFIGIVYISGPSMQPTFYTGDCILVLKTQDVSRYDIVVVEWGGKRLIKRAIGMPTEELAMQDGETKINNATLSEPFEYYSGHRSLLPLKIPDDHLFIMGDNRSNSHDSRAIGPVPMESVYGKMLCRLSFLSKIPFISKLIEIIANV